MSEQDHPPDTDASTLRLEDSDTTADEADLLRTRVRRLEEENRRLRDQYAGVRERRYRRTAIALAVVGLLFGGAGVVVTSAQEVLFAIAAAGLFGAVLTRYLTPEQFIPLDVSEGIYAALASNEAALANQLGLARTRLYLATDAGARLVVPEVDAYDDELLRIDDDDPAPLVVSDRAARSGLSLRPTAEPLLRAFEEQHGGALPGEPAEAVSTLAEAVTDALELAGGVETDLDSEEGRVTFSVTDPLYGDVTTFDHPVSSFFGLGLARALETPVRVDVVTSESDHKVAALVTCRWTPSVDEE